MASRYAGDFFGISLAGPDESTSKLLNYFPELKGRGLVDTTSKGKSEEADGATTVGGYRVPPSFAGFKTYRR